MSLGLCWPGSCCSQYGRSSNRLPELILLSESASLFHKELRNRNAENLATKMAEVTETKKLLRQVPGVAAVTKWVDQPKQLNPILSY